MLLILNSMFFGKVSLERWNLRLSTLEAEESLPLTWNSLMHDWISSTTRKNAARR